MVKLTHMIDYGNEAILFYDNGNTEIGYPANGDFWYVDGEEISSGGGGGTPPVGIFIYPFNFALATSPYGPRVNPFDPTKITWHSGIDGSTAAGVGNGDNVIAIGDGIVLAAGLNVRSGWGNSLILDHGFIGGNRLWSGYAHMQNGSPFFSKGASVDIGETIGIVGTTGVSTGPHLHFATWVNGGLVNPVDFMDTYA